MKVAIDAGHGLRKVGDFDSGACGGGHREADIAMEYALSLKYYLTTEHHIDCWLTRKDNGEPAPLAQRTVRAQAEHCTVLVSLHLNAAVDHSAHGSETLYYNAASRTLGERLQRAVVQETGFRDRGVKRRTDLWIVKYKGGPSVLVELGFISNDRDREWLLERENRIKVCRALASAISAYRG